VFDITSCIGIAGAVFSVLLFYPQLSKSIRTKSTKDIAHMTYVYIMLNSMLWLGYGIMANNPILYVPNFLAVCLSGIMLHIKRKYDEPKKD
jgi:MtN3 and saliva related transmembrane protein